MSEPITRTERDAAGLRALASREGDAKGSHRLLALAMMMEGVSRADAARAASPNLATSVHRLISRRLKAIKGCWS